MPINLTAPSLDQPWNVTYQSIGGYYQLSLVCDGELLFRIRDYQSGDSFRLADYKKDDEFVNTYLRKSHPTTKSVTVTVTLNRWASSEDAMINPNKYTQIGRENVTFSIGGPNSIATWTLAETGFDHADGSALTIYGKSKKHITAILVPQEYASVSTAYVSAGGRKKELVQVNDFLWECYIEGMTSSTDQITYTITCDDSRGYRDRKEVHMPYYVPYVPTIEELKVTRIANPSGVDPTTPNTTDAIAHVEFTVKFLPEIGNKVHLRLTSNVDANTYELDSDESGSWTGYVDIVNADYRNAYTFNVEFTDQIMDNGSYETLMLPANIPNAIMYKRETNFLTPVYVTNATLPTVITDGTTRTVRYPTGYQECWFEKTFSRDVTMQGSGISGYYAQSATGQQTIPVEFTEVFSVDQTIKSNNHWCYLAPVSGSTWSTSKTQSHWICANQSKAGATITIQYHVTGMWKEYDA